MLIIAHDDPLAPFWAAVGRVQDDQRAITDADMLAGLLHAPDSPLVRIIEHDGHDLEAARAAADTACFACAHEALGEYLGLTHTARCVADAMFEEQRVRGGAVRQEHVLLGLLLAASPEVKALLTRLGIDRPRVLRELPPAA
ncbi:MAG: Clp protease N-terminal domain-containing protein [Dehalococcoidia bacterium]